MTKKKYAVLISLILTAILAACSSLQLPGSATATPDAMQALQPGANQPVESKLALGTLLLEDTDQAVTAEQAKTLLPLWKAMKSLSSSDTASQDEINALYSQIKESMTAEQVSAIETMEMKPEDTQALMEKYGIQMPQFNDGSRPTISADQRATRQAQFQAQGGVPGGGPGEFAGGQPPAGFDSSGGPMMGGGQANAQGTPQPPSGGRGMRGGFNNIFVDPLIKVLEERAAS